MTFKAEQYFSFHLLYCTDRPVVGVMYCDPSVLFRITDSISAPNLVLKTKFFDNYFILKTSINNVLIAS